MSAHPAERELTAEEFGALRASIAAVGVLSPILVDEDGNVRDGRHRLRACDELGIPRDTVPTRIIDVNGADVPLHANVARRQLSRADLAAEGARLVAEGHSIRAAAKALGLSHATLARTAEREPSHVRQSATLHRLPWTSAEIAEVVERRRAGDSDEVIAAALGRSADALYRKMLTVRQAGEVEVPHPADVARSAWTAVDEAELLRRVGEGQPNAVIANGMGRTAGAVDARLRVLRQAGRLTGKRFIARDVVRADRVVRGLADALAGSVISLSLISARQVAVLIDPPELHDLLQEIEEACRSIRKFVREVSQP